MLALLPPVGDPGTSSPGTTDYMYMTSTVTIIRRASSHGHETQPQTAASQQRYKIASIDRDSYYSTLLAVLDV